VSRNIVWFSCGAASAVVAKLAIEDGLNPMIIYCDTMSTEHPDNQRFFDDVQQWLGREIIKIASKKYRDIDHVFMEARYMSGVNGARCTTEMKKVPRFDFQLPDDIHHFGYTIEEYKRIVNMRINNPELYVRFILAYRGITKAECLKMLPMKLPAMYDLGFVNNNCLGCVKATSPKYWNLTRKHFPDVFARRAEQSRELGVKLWRKGKQRFSLDELPPDDQTDNNEQIECGVVCQNEQA